MNSREFTPIGRFFCTGYATLPNPRFSFRLLNLLSIAAGVPVVRVRRKKLSIHILNPASKNWIRGVKAKLDTFRHFK